MHPRCPRTSAGSRLIQSLISSNRRRLLSTMNRAPFNYPPPHWNRPIIPNQGNYYPPPPPPHPPRPQGVDAWINHRNNNSQHSICQPIPGADFHLHHTFSIHRNFGEPGCHFNPPVHPNNMPPRPISQPSSNFDELFAGFNRDLRQFEEWWRRVIQTVPGAPRNPAMNGRVVQDESWRQPSPNIPADEEGSDEEPPTRNHNHNRDSPRHHGALTRGEAARREQAARNNRNNEASDADAAGRKRTRRHVSFADQLETMEEARRKRQRRE